MNLTFFGAGAAAAGIAALAGGLYWLQRLRVRHREIPVVTTLFWREAVLETRARELRLRFRHPLAYLFILGIAAALWFAAAGLHLASAADRNVVFLLDGSAGMARGTRFADAASAMRELLEDAPVAERSVIFCGATARTLLLPGEELAWFDRRLEGLAPEAAPSTVQAQLFSLAATATPERPLVALVYGDAHLEADAAQLLPDDVTLITFGEAQARTAECGITALGTTRAASGDWAAVDLLVELSGDSTRGLHLELGGTVIERAPEAYQAQGRRRLVFRDLPANGALAVARLDGSDALSADDEARYVLPLRNQLRVAADDSLAPVLGRVLAADPGVELVDDSPDVRVGGLDRGEEPSFAVIAGASELVVRAPAGDPGLAHFLERLDALGLKHALESDTGAVPVRVERGSPRALLVGAVAFDPARGWTQSQSFPLFVAEGLRWLAGTTDGPRFVAAGRAIANDSAFTDQSGHVLDPVGANFTPLASGNYTQAAGTVVATSLLDRTTTDDAASFFRVDSTASFVDDPADLAQLLALFAFVALLVEWVLVRRGRMP